MATVFLGNIKGPRGPQGFKGNDGAPGPLAVPTVEAVAAYVAGPTEAQAAVDARVLLAMNDSYLRNIVCAGDSITQGNQDGSGFTYPNMLAAAIGPDASVANIGQSGWTSTEVAARLGGVTFVLGAFTLPAGTAATAVTVTTPTDAFRTSAELFPSWLGVLNVDGVAVPGRLRHRIDAAASPVNGWTFERTTAGASVAVAAGATFVSTEYDSYLERTLIFMAGRNNITDPAIILRDVASTLARLTRPVKRFLILSVTTKTGETSGTAGYNQVKAINTALQAAYPNNYVDVRGYLIASGLSLNGLTATAADTAAIAGDNIPPQLLVADGVHPNRFGYRAIADKVLSKLIQLNEPTAVAAPLPSPSMRWLASSLTGVDGTNVASWAPTHGAIPLAQGTTAAQPKLLTAGGRKYVQFDGVDDMLEGALGLTQPFTLMVRAKVRSLAVVQGLAWPTGSGVTLTVETTGALRAAGLSSFSAPNGQVTAGGEYVFAAVIDGSSSRLKVEANTSATGDVGTGGLPTMRVGYAFSGSARYASIDVAEIRVYPLALAEVEINDIRSRM